MTDTADKPIANTPHAVKLVLRLRSNPRHRGALRRGGSPATERYAYPLLAGSWRAETKAAVLCFAAAAAHHDTIPDGNVRLGAALKMAFPDEDRAVQRLELCQTQTLPAFMVTVRRILDQAAPRLRSTGLSWTDLYWTLLNWDHPEPDRRDRARQRLCEDYWRAPETADPEATTAATS